MTSTTTSTTPPLMTTTLLRVNDILKIIPVSRSKFWVMVKTGEFPKPMKFGRLSCWSPEQVQNFIKLKIAESINLGPAFYEVERERLKACKALEQD